MSNQTKTIEKMTSKTKSLSTRQIAVLVFLLGTAVKLFSLPAALLQAGGRGAALALLIFLLLDLLTLALLIGASVLQPNKTAFEIVEERLGKIPAKIIFALVTVYLCIKTLLVLAMLSRFVGTELLEGMPWAVLLLPLIALFIVFGIHSSRAIGRLGEILVWPVALAVIVLFFFSLQSASFTNLLPFWGDSGASVSSPLRFLPLWFGDFTALFIVLGKRKKSKHFVKVTAISGAATAAVVLVFMVTIFASFATIRSILDPSKISQITQAGVMNFSIGRADKIFFVVLAAGVLVSLAVFFYAAARSASFVFNIKRRFWVFVTLAILLYLGAVLIPENALYRFAHLFGVYFAFVFSLAFPLLLLILAAIGKSKDKKKTKSKEVAHEKA